MLVCRMEFDGVVIVIGEALRVPYVRADCDWLRIIEEPAVSMSARDIVSEEMATITVHDFRLEHINIPTGRTYKDPLYKTPHLKYEFRRERVIMIRPGSADPALLPGWIEGRHEPRGIPTPGHGLPALPEHDRVVPDEVAWRRQKNGGHPGWAA